VVVVVVVVVVVGGGGGGNDHHGSVHQLQPQHSHVFQQRRFSVEQQLPSSLAPGNWHFERSIMRRVR
jgi:hypothetical protein